MTYPFKQMAKRRALAEKIIALAKEMGVMGNAQTRPIPGNRGADLRVNLIHPKGVSLNLALDFDGQSAKGIFVLSWHKAYSVGEPYLFSHTFNGATGRPHHKATDVCYDAEELLECLKDRWGKMNNGSAFVEEWPREPMEA